MCFLMFSLIIMYVFIYFFINKPNTIPYQSVFNDNICMLCDVYLRLFPDLLFCINQEIIIDIIYTHIFFIDIVFKKLWKV